jgi:hypothetical protein
MGNEDVASNKFVRILVVAFFVAAVAAVSLFLVLIHHRRPFAKILVYHSVSDDERGTPDPAIGKDLFARQMDFLSDHGYEPVFLSTTLRKYKNDSDTHTRIRLF